MCRVQQEIVRSQLLEVLRGASGLPALAAFGLLQKSDVCLAHFCEAVHALSREGAVRSSDPSHPVHPDLPAARILELGLEAPLEPSTARAGDGKVRLLAEGFRLFLDQRLGRGSSARVFLGEQVRLKRPVAVKLLDLKSLPAGVPRDWFVERFRREPAIIARLNHPHIVQVIDCGEEGDELWYAMELISGGTLLDRIRREGKIPPDEVRSCFRAMAGALQEAFRHGILHRDVKPGNVFVSGLKLADFGLAKLPPAPAEEGIPGAVTPRAAVVGTPPYVAPERASHESGDLRSDIYSLGATMYHAATGGYLFDLDPGDRARWYSHHLHVEPRPLTDRDPGFPKDLAAIIRRCLAKDPGDRYPSFESLVEALEA